MPLEEEFRELCPRASNRHCRNAKGTAWTREERRNISAIGVKVTMEGYTLTKPVSFWSSINNPAVKAEMPVATLGQAVEKIAIYLKFLGVIEVYAGMGTFLHTNQR